ncbi:hypothetical protein THAOC_25070, partial [Thalassiosira oceanica]
QSKGQPDLAEPRRPLTSLPASPPSPSTRPREQHAQRRFAGWIGATLITDRMSNSTHTSSGNLVSNSSTTASNSCCDGETETSSLSSYKASTTVAEDEPKRPPSLGMPRAMRWFHRFDSSKMRRSASAHNPQAGI